MKKINAGFVLVALAFLSGCGPKTLLQREAYAETAPALQAATEKLSVATKENLAEVRLTQRLIAFQVAATSYLVKNPGNDKSKYGPFKNKSETKKADLAAETILCEPRVTYRKYADAQSLLGTFSSDIARLSADPSASITDLVKALGASYSPPLVRKPGASPEFQTACTEDLNGYIDDVYPLKSQSESLVAAVAGAEVVLDAIKDLIEPAIRGGLQQVDKARRAQALSSYLQRDTTREALQRSIQDSGELIKNSDDRTRAFAVKTYVDALNGFEEAFSNSASGLRFSSPGETASPHNANADCQWLMNQANVAGTDSTILRRDRRFQRCFAQIWSAWEPKVEAVLVSAAAYDAIADAEANTAAKSLADLSAKLQSIAEGELSREEILRYASRVVVSVANYVEESKKSLTSDEKQKAVKDALKTFREAL